MKDEKVIEYLKEANFLGNENLYFYTPASPKTSKQENIYGLDALTIKYYIINKNENGIGIIPFDVTAKSIKSLIKFIPNSEISGIYKEDYKVMFIFKGTTLGIKLNDGKVLELDYIGNENGTGQALNMYKFSTLYQTSTIKEDSTPIEDKKQGINIDFALTQNTTVNNNDKVYKIVTANNENEKENYKNSYKNLIIEAINNKLPNIYFYVEEVPLDKKIAELTSSAIIETTFDLEWYFSDNNIDCSNTKITILSKDEQIQEFYKNAFRKMGFRI